MRTFFLWYSYESKLGSLGRRRKEKRHKGMEREREKEYE